MASRYASSGSSDSYMVGNPTTSNSNSQQSSSSSSSSTSNSFTGIQDEEALTLLKNLIKQLATGGTDQQKEANAERKQTIQDTRASAADYTKDKAFKDAADLVSQSLQNAMEKQMPAISKSIQGAGTSSSSMQGLLSQKLAADSSQAAGALGAQQATAYGGITANLASVLERLTQADSTTENSLINALALLRNTVSNSNSVSSSYSQGNSTSTSSGGGTSRVSAPQSGGSFPSGVESTSASYANTPIDQGTYEYLVYQTPGAFADYTSDNGYTSNDLPSGYMSITNTTDYYSDYDNSYADNSYYGDWSYE